MRTPILILLFLFPLFPSSVYSQPGKQKKNILEIQPGAERLGLYLPLLKGRSVGIFANQTSMVGSKHLVDTLIHLGIEVKVIFGPEHGFRGTAGAGEKVGNYTDEKTGVPVVSLYGTKRRPDEKDLSGVDVLLFDIQDVGVRFYTFISSLEAFMQSAIEYNKPLIILDRPNPNGFYVDGPVLDTKFRSFIGMQPIPVVYGLTIGEYAHLLWGEGWINTEGKIPAATEAATTTTMTTTANPVTALGNSKSHDDPFLSSCSDEKLSSEDINENEFKLIVVCCKNYSHKSLYQLPVRPSPNLPNMQSIYLYPSTCFFEGTSLSEGRGTDKPFQVFGHPSLPTSLFSFTPNPNEGAKNSKHYGQVCYGWQVGGTVPEVLQKINGKLQLKWLLEAYHLFPQQDSFFLRPKSGDMKQSFFAKLSGNNELWQQVRNGIPEEAIRKSWEPALKEYKTIRKKYLLYEDFE